MVRSHGDLPLKTFQIVNTFRYETKQTRSFIRVREIHFFEAHTAHKDQAGADAQIAQDAEIVQNLLRGDCFLVGGMESMSRVKRRGFNWSPHPSLEDSYPAAYINMGMTAENVAEKFGISRLRQEEFALASHEKSAAAQQAGHFDGRE